MKTKSRTEFVEWFRDAAPYVHTHREETFVVYLGPDALAGPHAGSLLADIALLAVVGIRVVLVYGTRALIDARLAAAGRSSTLVAGLRVTDDETLAIAIEVAGRRRFEIEARLSTAAASTPLAGAPVRAVSGNFVHARPSGVRDGVDLQHTGEVRGVDAEAIRHRLEDGQVVLVPPLGFAPSGEVFNLDALSLATGLAIELHAAKLILVEDAYRLADDAGTPLRQLSVRSAREELNRRRSPSARLGPAEVGLEALTTACRHTVRRGHLLDGTLDGVLVLELFTRDGVGTMVAADAYDDTRPATMDDVAGIRELIGPLEAEGALVPRAREQIERDVERFLVMERDGSVIGCAALYPFGGGSAVELACFAVHARYRDGERGEALLARAEQEARRLGAHRLFALTTQTAHWFREHGFRVGVPADLPPDRPYDRGRNAKILVKAIDAAR